MELIALRVAATVLSLLVFLGILAWAYGGPQRRRFEHDAQLPFLEDQPLRTQDVRAAQPRAARSASLHLVPLGRAGKE